MRVLTHSEFMKLRLPFPYPYLPSYLPLNTLYGADLERSEIPTHTPEITGTIPG